MSVAYRQLASAFGFTADQIADMTPAQRDMYMSGPPPGATESIDKRTGKATATFSTMNEARAYLNV